MAVSNNSGVSNLDAAKGPELLDLGFLTDEEREKLESVLRADEDLKIKDRIRIGCVVRGREWLVIV